MSSRRIVSVLALLVCTTAFAEDPETVMVMEEGAPLMLGKDEVGKASLGEVVTYTNTNGDWVWIPERDGWIEKRHIATFDVAKNKIDRLIATKPTVDLLQQRAVIHMHQDRLGDAIKDLNQALEIDDRRSSILVHRGNVWLRGDNTDQAVAEYSLAVAMNPEDTAALNSRASLLIDREQFKEAIQDIEAVLKAEPKSAMAHLNRGRIRLAKDRDEAALADFQKAIDLSPGYAVAFWHRGLIHERAGRDAAAIKDYRKALTLRPSLDEAANNLAWILATTEDEELHDLENAMKFAMRANTRTGFENWNYLDTLGVVCGASGKTKLARDYFEKAIKNAPEDEHDTIKQHRRKYAEK